MIAPHQDKSRSGLTAASGSEKRSSQRKQKATNATSSEGQPFASRAMSFERENRLSESKAVRLCGRSNPTAQVRAYYPVREIQGITGSGSVSKLSHYRISPARCRALPVAFDATFLLIERRKPRSAPHRSRYFSHAK